MSQRRSVLLVGGPDAGKTNYLARLWLAVHAGAGRLKADGLPSDLAYLQAQADMLLRGRFAPHTPRGALNWLSIPLRDTSVSPSVLGQLIIPDSSGEEWLKIYQSREWSQDWENAISDALGCLLFIRVDSDQIVAPLDWLSFATQFGSPVGHPMPAQEAIQETPTQVVLTDWLQCLRQAFTHHRGGHFRPRVGVVVSAWDRVPLDQQADSPASYLKVNFPLFYQFIRSNSSDFDCALFGVSVVGGDLKLSMEFRDSYLNGEPHKAGYVLHELSGQLEQSSDLTLPVAWALGLDL